MFKSWFKKKDENDQTIELGQECVDSITGFKGIATGECKYISGCDQILLSPRVGDDGVFKEAHWFDRQRIFGVSNEVIKLDNSETPGFDTPAPKR